MGEPWTYEPEWGSLRGSGRAAKEATMTTTYEIRTGIGDGEGEHRLRTTDRATAVHEFLALRFRNRGAWKRMLIDGDRGETWTWKGDDWDIQAGRAVMDMAEPSRTRPKGELRRVGGDPRDLRAAKERGRREMEDRIDAREGGGDNR